MEAGSEAVERSYVGLGRRLLAMLIDNGMWFFGAALLLGSGLEALYEESPDAGVVATFVLASLWFNYFAFCEWRWGQTVGKNAVGIEVVSLDGAEERSSEQGGGLTFAQASMRNLLRLVDFFVVGWVLIATGERRQRLGDRAAGTVVVARPRARVAATTTATATAPVVAAAAASSGPGAPPPPPPGRRPAPPPPGWAGDPLPPSEPLDAPPPPPTVAGTTFPGWVTWSGRDVVKGLVAGLLIGLLIAPALVLPFDPDLSSDGALLAAQGLLGTTLMAVAIAGATNWNFRGAWAALRRLGVRPFSPSGIGWMFAMLGAYYVFAVLFTAFIVEPEQEDIGEQLGIGDENIAVAVLAVVLIVGLAPISEELFFRGFVYGGLRTKFGFWPAVIIAGLIFGSIHAPTGITTVIPLAVLGGGFCWLYEKTGSIWPCVIAHMINNGIAVAAAGAADGSVLLPLTF